MLRAAACCLCLLCACHLESGSRGDQCTRSTQCRVGLACVEGACSDDLTAIAEQSEVPELVMAEPEAGVDASTPDAGVPDGARSSSPDAAAADSGADAAAMATDGGDGG